MDERLVQMLAEIFKLGWHAADARGETGHRTEAGIRRVLASGLVTDGDDPTLIERVTADTIAQALGGMIDDYTDPVRDIVARVPFAASVDQFFTEKYGVDIYRRATRER